MGKITTFVVGIHNILMCYVIMKRMCYVIMKVWIDLINCKYSEWHCKRKMKIKNKKWMQKGCERESSEIDLLL